MKRLEKRPTDENILNTFLSDEIGRNKTVFQFLNVLENVEEGMTIALDGEWGTGKTFFVKQIKMILDAFNEQTVFNNEDRERIKRLCAKNSNPVSDTPRACVYYDAWEHDDFDDPMLSLIYEIVTYTGKGKENFSQHHFIEAAFSIADFITNRNVSGIKNAFTKSDSLQEIKEKKDLHELINEFLDEITDEWGNTLIIFIDELDRCNPLYAVKLLERIKHYFDNEKITFVFSVNLHELQHTIKSVYGESFNASHYLNRFFDLVCTLPEVSSEVFSKSFSISLSDVSSVICQKFSFSLRDQSHFFQMLNICGLGKHKKSIAAVHPFVQMIILPIMIGLRIYDFNMFTDFISGNDFSVIKGIMVDVVEDTDNSWIYKSFFDKKIAPFLNPDADESHKAKIINDGIEKLCGAIFKLEGFDYSSYQKIGQIEVYRETKTQLLETINAMNGLLTMD